MVMTGIKRNLNDKLNRLLKIFPVVMLLGARQTGKTTLAQTAWHFEALKASWSTPQEIKSQYRSASILKNNRVVFNIAENKYRLIVSIDYKRQASLLSLLELINNMIK